MLAIARALINDPKLLILDEPTEGLAPVIVDELVRSWEGKDSRLVEEAVVADIGDLFVV